jgi:hypothetical protein
MLVLIAKKSNVAIPFFVAFVGVFTPMEHRARSRFRGARTLRYPSKLMATAGGESSGQAGGAEGAR